MDYKTLFNIALDYILFNSDNLNFKQFLTLNNLKDSKYTRAVYVNAYKKAVYLLSH